MGCSLSSFGGFGYEEEAVDEDDTELNSLFSNKLEFECSDSSETTYAILMDSSFFISDFSLFSALSLDFTSLLNWFSNSIRFEFGDRYKKEEEMKKLSKIL